MALDDSNKNYQYIAPVKPSHWQGEESRFYVQLLDILDEIYSWKGRLNTKDLSTKTVDWLNGIQSKAEDASGKTSEFEQTVDGFRTDVQGYNGEMSQMRQTVEGFNRQVSNYAGAVTEYQQTVNGFNQTVQSAVTASTNAKSVSEQLATKIGLSVSGTVVAGDAQVGKVFNNGVTIDTNGVDVHGGNVNIDADSSLNVHGGNVDIGADSSFRVSAGADFAVNSPNFAVDESGNVFINGNIMKNGEKILTVKDIYITSIEPTDARSGSIWISPGDFQNAIATWMATSGGEKSGWDTKSSSGGTLESWFQVEEVITVTLGGTPLGEYTGNNFKYTLEADLYAKEKITLYPSWGADPDIDKTEYGQCNVAFRLRTATRTIGYFNFVTESAFKSELYHLSAVISSQSLWLGNESVIYADFKFNFSKTYRYGGGSNPYNRLDYTFGVKTGCSLNVENGKTGSGWQDCTIKYLA